MPQQTDGARDPATASGGALAIQPRALLIRLKSDPLLRNSAIYVTGGVLTGLLGYVFHFETGHLLGPAAYSTVASAIAALYVLTIPLVGLQLVSARFASVAAARDQQHAVIPMLRRLATISLPGGILIAILLSVLSSPVAAFLNLSDHRVVYLLAATGLTTLLVTLARGALQGLRRFIALSSNMLLDVASRLAIAAALIAAGFGALGAISAIALGPLVALPQSLYLLRRTRRDVAPTERLEGIGSFAILATVASVGVNYLFSIDTLLAKHYLTAEAAGIYAASAVLARVVYFLGLAVAGVMFPEVASLHARNEAHFHIVDMSLLLVGGMGLALIAAYALVPGLVLLPYGASFDPARPYIAVFAIALSMLTVANLLINYFLSLARGTFVVPLFAACVIETVLIGFFHRGIFEILGMVLITMGLLSGAVGAMYVYDRVNLRRAPR